MTLLLHLSAAEAAGVTWPSEIIEIESGSAHEVCMDLAKGEVLSYRFKAAPLARFNIHHHDGDDVVYSHRSKALMERSSFVAPEENHYCLMWINREQEPLRLQIGYERRGIQ